MDIRGMIKVRESNFELLRLIAMFFIVWYHLLLKFIVVVDESPIYKAMFIPLHVAVVCFVLISGYFHIKPTLRGGGKLLYPLLVFYLPLTLYEILQCNMAVGNLLFFSKTSYWFIRTYFYLFLMAPILNSYLVSNKRRVYLLLVLFFMAIYMGWLMHDRSMFDGKNLVLFMFLYVLGDSLRQFKDLIDKVSTPVILVIYLFLNMAHMIVYVFYSDSFIGEITWNLSYPYCSPILILNAVLLFILFSRLHFKSKSVNWLAGSVFAVYIIHHQNFVLYKLIGPLVLTLYGEHYSPLILILYLGLYSLLIMFVCIMIDKLFTPLYNVFIQYVAELGEKANKSLDRIVKLLA